MVGMEILTVYQEKDISFSKSIYANEKKLKYKIQFINSFKFMSTSIDKLVNNPNENRFEHTGQHLVMNNVNFGTRSMITAVQFAMH